MVEEDWAGKRAESVGVLTGWGMGGFIEVILIDGWTLCGS